jgi:hypothetical protein
LPAERLLLAIAIGTEAGRQPAILRAQLSQKIGIEAKQSGCGEKF